MGYAAHMWFNQALASGGERVIEGGDGEQFASMQKYRVASFFPREFKKDNATTY